MAAVQIKVLLTFIRTAERRNTKKITQRSLVCLNAKHAQAFLWIIACCYNKLRLAIMVSLSVYRSRCGCRFTSFTHTRQQLQRAHTHTLTAESMAVLLCSFLLSSNLDCELKLMLVSMRASLSLFSLSVDGGDDNIAVAAVVGDTAHEQRVNKTSEQM